MHLQLLITYPQILKDIASETYYSAGKNMIKSFTFNSGNLLMYLLKN